MAGYMMNRLSISAFQTELKSSLPKSTAREKHIWAAIIIERGFEIKTLSALLLCEKEVALPFSWLLSDIGILSPDTLLKDLPYLFELSDKVRHFNFKLSFASYWRLCGVPPENEAEAIDLLFEWLRSPGVNVTTKSRASFVLLNLTKKYPELKDELKISLQEQMEHQTKDFRKRAEKIIAELDR